MCKSACRCAWCTYWSSRAADWNGECGLVTQALLRRRCRRTAASLNIFCVDLADDAYASSRRCTRCASPWAACTPELFDLA